MKRLKLLITGAKGQLGREFVKILNQKDEAECYSFGKEILDVRDFRKTCEIIKNIKPDVVINCSAYNWVDKSEEEFEKAFSVNALGPLNLAIACQEVDAFLVHYSTDYVFDGKKEGFYLEEDKPNPLNKYALSKYLGEKNLLAIKEGKFLIFRTSWVYGEGKQNFLYKLTQWAQSQEYLKIACDEFSVPTSTRTIVEITLKALEKGLTGLYHLVNSGYASRYDWAKEYFRINNIKKFIYPAYQHEFNLPAKRPRWSVMSNEKICKELGIEIIEWEEALKKIEIPHLSEIVFRRKPR